MAWYWWVVAVILGLNAMVIAVVALFLAADWLRSRRADAGEGEETGR